MAYKYDVADIRLAKRVERASLETWRLRRIVDALLRLREADNATSDVDEPVQFIHVEQRLFAEIARRDKLHPPEKPKMRLKGKGRTSVDEAVDAARRSAAKTFDHRR